MKIIQVCLCVYILKKKKKLANRRLIIYHVVVYLSLVWSRQALLSFNVLLELLASLPVNLMGTQHRVERVVCCDANKTQTVFYMCTYFQSTKEY